MQITKSEVTKIPYLDGLRGVAALMVMFAHLMITLYPAVITFLPSEVHTSYDVALGISPFSFLWRGNFAVCIFFVISGYVLSEFCSKTKLSFPAQIVRRYFRLAFPMLITSMFAWALLRFNLYNNYKASSITHSGWLSMWYQFHPYFFKMVVEALYGAFVKGSAIYNSNLWTMQIELIGSVYVFLLHSLFKNRYLRLGLIIWYISNNIHNYLILFACGAFLFDFKDEIILFLRLAIPYDRLRNIFVIMGFCFSVYLGAFPELQPGMTSPWYPGFTPHLQGWHMLGATLLVMFLFNWQKMQEWLGSQIGKFLGKISFVLYLIHLPIICCLTAWIIYFTRRLPYPVATFLAAGLTIPFVVLISALTYQYVDQYTTSFSRWAGRYFDRCFSFKNKKLVDEEQGVERPEVVLEGNT